MSDVSSVQHPRLFLPDGYSDVPAGKIAAVVAHLEMTEPPSLPPDPAGAWTLRRVETPGLDWFRDLHRRIGDEWLWSSRLRMTDAQLAAMIRSPLIEMYALEHDGRDEGVLELDFCCAGECELRLFGVTAETHRQRRRPLADESGAGADMVATGQARLAAHPQPRSSGGAGVLSALGFPRVPAPDRNIR